MGTHDRSYGTPGPCVYDCREALRAVSGVMGKSKRETVKPYQYPNLGKEDAADASVPDSGEYRYRSSYRATFGTEERFRDGGGPELARVSPDAHYGKDGPGLVYDPDDRPSRPKSAPAYSMR